MDKNIFDFFVSVRDTLFSLHDFYDDSKNTSEPFYDRVTPEKMEHFLDVLKSRIIRFLNDINILHYREYRSCSNEKHHEILGNQYTFLVNGNSETKVLVSESKSYYNEETEFFQNYRSEFCACSPSMISDVYLCEYLVVSDSKFKKLASNAAVLLFHLIEAISKCQPRKTRSSVRESLLWSVLSCNDIILNEDIDDYIKRIRNN